jgi:DNA polymerase III delta prime subunit
MHLLKWQYQPKNQSTNWVSNIKESRKQIERLIKKHPVLRVHLERVFLECYLDAREDAADETGLSISTFPLECPFDLQSVLDKDWLPS